MTIRSMLFAIPLLVMTWLATLVTVSLLGDESPASVVLFPSAEFTQNLPEDVSVLDWGNWAITLTSKQPNVARRLYASGAWIVLPAGLSGCLPLPQSVKLAGRAAAN